MFPGVFILGVVCRVLVSGTLANCFTLRTCFVHIIRTSFVHKSTFETTPIDGFKEIGFETIPIDGFKKKLAGSLAVGKSMILVFFTTSSVTTSGIPATCTWCLASGFFLGRIKNWYGYWVCWISLYNKNCWVVLGSLVMLHLDVQSLYSVVPCDHRASVSLG